MVNKNRLRSALARTNVVRGALVVAVLLASPSLFFGLALDDRLQRQSALGESALYDLGPFNLFAFVPGPSAHTLSLIESGFGPWWSDLDARIVLLRPVSSALMWFDYQVLRDPILIHAHSILWYAATAVLAGVLFRRWIGVPWISGLAALMFAMDPTHGLLVGWIAQRNALVAGTFGLAALWLHDRAMRERRLSLDAAASVCLGLALFSAEAALGAVAYLVAHAWFLDARRLRGLWSLLPPVLIWACVYKLGDYGAQGSGLYVDPIHEPAQFAENALRHGPLLVAGELGLPGPDLYLIMSPAQQAGLIVAAVLLVLAFVLALRPLLSRDPVTRFFVAGALLSVIPSCATFPSGRLLFFASFGLVGALAQLFGAYRDRDPALGGWARPVVYFTAAFHLFLAPVLFIASSAQMLALDRILLRTAAGVPNVPELDAQRVVVVNAPDATFLGYVAPIRAARGEHAPRSVLAMAAGVRPLELTRSGERSLTLRSSAALVQPGTDLLMRGKRPFEVGDGVAFADVTIEFTEVNANGWPTEARFDFTAPLDDPSLRFMQWQDQTLRPLALPAVGESVAFPAQDIAVFGE